MDGLKQLFKSKKALALLVGVLSHILGLYVFKDNAEMASKVSEGVIIMVGTYIGAQGMADAFGSNKYHDKSKDTKKKK